MNKEIFEVQYINLIGNVLIRYKHSRLPLVLYRFDRPKNDDYSVFNSIKNLKKSHIYFLGKNNNYKKSIVINKRKKVINKMRLKKRKSRLFR